MSPPITVLMTVYNGEAFLPTAIESILKQTYEDFRFLIVDDQSTDRTRDVVRSYSDKRIDLLCLDQNVGQTSALVAGFDQIQSPWVARMDADDYAAPTRFEQQMALLTADSSLGCVGTWAWIFREDFRRPKALLMRPETHRDIATVLLWDSPLIHGSMIVSREAMVRAGGYDRKYRYSADWDLYDRLFLECKAANVPEPLMGLRHHSGQGSLSGTVVEEAIRILTRRLSDVRYSKHQLRSIRSALSTWYLRRAYDASEFGKYPEILRHFLKACRLSPATPLWYAFPSSIRQRRVIKTWGFGERPWTVFDRLPYNPPYSDNPA